MFHSKYHKLLDSVRLPEGSKEICDWLWLAILETPSPETGTTGAQRCHALLESFDQCSSRRPTGEQSCHSMDSYWGRLSQTCPRQVTRPQADSTWATWKSITSMLTMPIQSLLSKNQRDTTFNPDPGLFTTKIVRTVPRETTVQVLLYVVDDGLASAWEVALLYYSMVRPGHEHPACILHHITTRYWTFLHLGQFGGFLKK